LFGGGFIYDLKEIESRIISSPDKILKVLEYLNYDNIREKDTYFQFPNHNGDNMSACSIYKNTLAYINFSHNKQGNLFTLVKEEKGFSLKGAISKIIEITEIDDKDLTRKKIKYPFGGFYKKLNKKKSVIKDDYKIYDEDLLPPSTNLSTYWLKDCVSLLSMEKFGVRYSFNNEILIPIYDLFDNLIGCKVRKIDADSNNRFYSLLGYSKTRVLYGLNVNYSDILNKNILFIFESEKSVLQCDSYGMNCAVAIGGHNISNIQSDMIKGLRIDKIIVAFDEGIPEEEIIYNCNKLKLNNLIVKNKVGYIFDNDNEFLEKGSKDSPSDLGKDKFLKLMKNKTVWLE